MPKVNIIIIIGRLNRSKTSKVSICKPFCKKFILENSQIVAQRKTRKATHLLINFLPDYPDSGAFKNFMVKIVIIKVEPFIVQKHKVQ